jgi:ADP-heptose:LPS heptosyltransferase
VILPGWNAEGSNAEEIAAAGPLRVMALAKRLALAVANDSGTSHMLAAVDTPLISLFGPTPAAKFAPLVSRRKVLTAQQFGSNDMAAISIDAVESALTGLFAETAVAGSSSRA